MRPTAPTPSPRKPPPNVPWYIGMRRRPVRHKLLLQSQVTDIATGPHQEARDKESTGCLSA